MKEDLQSKRRKHQKKRKKGGYTGREGMRKGSKPAKDIKVEILGCHPDDLKDSPVLKKGSK